MLTGSKKEILDLIKRKGVLSINEISTYAGLAKTTLREHLLHLESDGYIKRNYQRSGPGRPALQYQLTRHGHSLYPSGESALLKNFISFLKKRGEETTIENFFEEFWENRFRKAEQLLDEADADNREERLKVLMKILSDEGFMPEYQLNEADQTFEIRECNCPFKEVVKETQLPCQLELEFYKKIFNCEVERTAYLVDGDFSCSYSIYDGQ